MKNRTKKEKITFIVFVDLENVFDYVKRNKMYNAPKRIGVPYKDRRVKLVQTSRTTREKSGRTKNKVGAIQECTVFSSFFIVCV